MHLSGRAAVQVSTVVLVRLALFWSMLDRLLGRVHDTKHGAPLLRGYLWWGLVIRSVLLVALGVLLLVEGNVLAEWLLSARVPFVSADDVEELTTISYAVIFVLLTVGVGGRWRLLHRLDAIERAAVSVDASSSEQAATPDD